MFKRIIKTAAIGLGAWYFIIQGTNGAITQIGPFKYSVGGSAKHACEKARAALIAEDQAGNAANDQMGLEIMCLKFSQCYEDQTD